MVGFSGARGLKNSLLTDGGCKIGVASMTACDTVPPYLYDAMAALRGLPLFGHGVGSVAALNKDFSQLTFIVGVVKLDCGGIKPFGMAMMALMKSKTPAPAFRWPILDLTEPMKQGSDSDRRAPDPYTFAIAAHSVGSPTGVDVAWASM